MTFASLPLPADLAARLRAARADVDGRARSEAAVRGHETRVLMAAKAGDDDEGAL